MKNMFKSFGIIIMVMIIGFSFAACNDGSGNNYTGTVDTVPAALQGTWDEVYGDSTLVFTGTTFTYTLEGSSYTVGNLSFGTISKATYLEMVVLSELENNASDLAQLGVTEDKFDDIVNAINNDTLDEFIAALGLGANEAYLDPLLNELDELLSSLDTITIYSYNGEVTAVNGFLANVFSVGDPMSSNDYGPILLSVEGTIDSFNYLFQKQ